MLLRQIAVLAAVIASAMSVGAEMRAHLEGDVRPVPGAPYAFGQPVLFNAAGAPAATFAVDAYAPELDFRAAPGAISIATPAGTLTAEAPDPPALYGALPRDPTSGRPLKIGAAENATCPTGAEPDCWVSGDPTPEDVAVADALLALQSSLQPLGERVVDPVSGRPRRPGNRATVRPSNLDVDGSGAGYRQGVRAGGNGEFGRRDFVWSDPFPALSWNLLLSLAMTSGDGQPPIEPGEFDPAQPYATGFCSLVTPQYCSSVQLLFALTTQLLDDDPSGSTALRYLWEAGARYDVIDATGDLAAYAGGSVHVLGLERARGDVAELGFPLVLFPAGATLDPTAPFAIATPDAPETPSFGMAYATAPEPAAAGLGLALILSLVGRAHLRDRSRR